MRVISRIRLKLILILMIACTALGFIAAFKIANPSEETSAQWISPDTSNSSIRFITHDTILNELQNKQELIPLELDLTEKVTINDSWGEIEFFKKLQNVYLVAKGIYSLDLSQISSDNISLSSAKKSIIINAPKPTVKVITIDEQKTIYETTQNGILRFGEIKLTPSEYQRLLYKAKSIMNEKMYSSDLYEQAINSSEWALKNLIQALLGKDNNYSITVRFQ
jgi:hypothetical protein